jgi:SLT domain-containing protein
MAVGSRTLKLSILGDVDQLKKSLVSGTKEVQTFGSKISDFGKKAGVAFAAAGAAALAYAGKALVESTKNAIADEAAQRRLALTLQNVAGATRSQIANLESQITKTSLLFGVTDDQLRPAYERLVRSTNDISKAQDILNIAMDVAAATGKPLETITAALAKAYDGNAASLGRLGLGVDQNILKSKDFDAITSALRLNFKGFAEQEANTFEAKLRRLQIAFDEGKETIGAFILDAITPMVTVFVTKAVPAIQAVAEEIGPKLTPLFQTLGNFMNTVLLPAFTSFYNFIKNYIVPILDVTLVPIIKAIFNGFNTIATALKDNETNLKPLTDAFKTFATFLRDTVAPIIGSFISGSISGIAGVIAALIDVVGDVTTAVNSGFNRVKTFFTNIINYIDDTADALVSPIVRVFKSAINTIIGLWNKLDFAITFTVPDWVPVIGGQQWSSGDIFPDIPYLANGGIVNSPTLAMIGEAGPEAVIPLSKSGIMGNTINVTVNGAIDPESTARQIISILNNSSYRGTLGAGALVS